MIIKIRRRKRRERGEETAPKIESRVSKRNDKTSKRRSFRLERLEKKTALIKQRKWVFMSIAIIAVAIAAIIFKVL